MARPKLPVVLTPQQNKAIDRIVSAPSTPQKIVNRARIVLLAAEGRDNDEIAKLVGVSKPTVGMWRQRFVDEGLAGLDEAPRPGRPEQIDAGKIERVLTEVVKPPPGRARWSCRSMARHVGLSKDTVQRIWASNDIKPHRTRTFKLSERS